ncbi:MAG: carbohydrate-binding protein, partial [Planctomycetota bacterium]
GSKGFEVLVDDEVIDRQTVPATGGWQTYTTLSSSPVTLAKGQHQLRFRSVGNEWNINWFEIRAE